MKIVHYIVAVAALNCVVLAEPSVYGNSAGFSSPQTTMIQNKKKLLMLNSQIAQQKEQIDGLKSIVEGLSATVHELSQKLEGGNLSASANNDNGTLLHDLGMMIDKINADYVTKEELHQAIGGKAVLSAHPKQTSAKSQSNNSPSTAYSEGVRLFVKHRYDEAKKRFLLTDSQGYKAAASNYYLGEISYYTKKYEDAIFYYKKSAGLNDKASYIDTLLLHTAISLENRGELDQAKVFYENIIANYPNKKTAEIAHSKLKKI